jgi:S1-C subfamily serine protease
MGSRAWLAAIAVALAFAQQPPGTLRIRITIADAGQQTRPVPRHALLISDNPTTAAPQRAITNAEGTAEIRLRPGNYTIESDEPLIFQGKAYEWRQTLDIVSGEATSVEFNAANAEVEAADARPSGAAASASGLLLDWQNSVVTIWTPLKRGAGFLIDARGLVATNQRLVGTEKAVEVQLGSVKVAGRVLVADPERNVAIVWIDPGAAAAGRPMRLRFAGAGQPLAQTDRVYTINVPMDDEKNLSSGAVRRINPGAILSDVRVEDDSLGAPLLTASGEVVAITTPTDEMANISSSDTLAIRIDAARDAIAAAEKKMAQEIAPPATHLPVERAALFPDDPLREAAARRKGALRPYRVSAADFDVSMITPPLAFAARHPGADRPAARGRRLDARDIAELEAARHALQEFGNWWDYVRRDPPVLMVRATPKMVESFWKSMLRGAVQTQGVSLPPIKRIKAGLARMQLSCGSAQVTPIHPFKIEHRIGDTEAVYEGLYIYDPASIGPQCATVTLTLFSDKAPDKGDTRVLDVKILQQIHEDFAPYRTPPK